MEPHAIPRPKLLTVDDEVNILKSLKRTLRRCEIDVTIANSGEEALKIMEGVEFDVIMSDMRMPEMSGAEFLAQASALQPESKRILLTGYSDIESTIEAINKGGVSTYLAKPWDDDHLIRVVNDAVNVKRLISQNANLEALTKLQNEELIELNTGLERKVEERTLEIETASSMLEKAVEDLTGSYDTMVSLLANTAALRDRAGSEKSGDKVDLALAMAAVSGLEPLETRAIGQAMQLHRIGRLSLPDHLLSKPYLQLTDTEQEKFHQHPIFAEAALMGVPELNGAALLIRHQNERWDGEGFPDRKVRDNIPLGSRILTIARDYYDLIGGQYDRKRYRPVEALKFIQESSQTLYDPKLIETLETALSSLNLDNEPIVAVEAAKLVPGMRLASDLKSTEGMMLLRKDQELTAALVAKLQNLAKSSGSALSVNVWGE